MLSAVGTISMNRTVLKYNLFCTKIMQLLDYMTAQLNHPEDFGVVFYLFLNYTCL